MFRLLGEVGRTVASSQWRACQHSVSVVALSAVCPSLFPKAPGRHLNSKLAPQVTQACVCGGSRCWGGERAAPGCEGRCRAFPGCGAQARPAIPAAARGPNCCVVRTAQPFSAPGAHFCFLCLAPVAFAARVLFFLGLCLRLVPPSGPRVPNAPRQGLRAGFGRARTFRGAKKQMYAHRKV